MAELGSDDVVRVHMMKSTIATPDGKKAYVVRDTPTVISYNDGSSFKCEFPDGIYGWRDRDVIQYLGMKATNEDIKQRNRVMGALCLYVTFDTVNDESFLTFIKTHGIFYNETLTKFFIWLKYRGHPDIYGIFIGAVSFLSDPAKKLFAVATQAALEQVKLAKGNTKHSIDEEDLAKAHILTFLVREACKDNIRSWSMCHLMELVSSLMEDNKYLKGNHGNTKEPLEYLKEIGSYREKNGNIKKYMPAGISPVYSFDILGLYDNVTSLVNSKRNIKHVSTYGPFFKVIRGMKWARKEARWSQAEEFCDGCHTRTTGYAKCPGILTCNNEACPNKKPCSEMFHCAGCLMVYYCGESCQRADYSVHKPRCVKKTAEEKENPL
jgi:hypothetical protein